MSKLDTKNLEAFGDASRNVIMHLSDEVPAEQVGALIENIYRRFQRESERDARDKANGKGG